MHSSARQANLSTIMIDGSQDRIQAFSLLLIIAWRIQSNESESKTRRIGNIIIVWSQGPHDWDFRQNARQIILTMSCRCSSKDAQITRVVLVSCGCIDWNEASFPDRHWLLSIWNGWRCIYISAWYQRTPRNSSDHSQCRLWKYLAKDELFDSASLDAQIFRQLAMPYLNVLWEETTWKSFPGHATTRLATTFMKSSNQDTTSWYDITQVFVCGSLTGGDQRDWSILQRCTFLLEKCTDKNHTLPKTYALLACCRQQAFWLVQSYTLALEVSE